jgi:hypothetical protein
MPLWLSTEAGGKVGRPATWISMGPGSCQIRPAITLASAAKRCRALAGQVCRENFAN